jgi:hypothetical protein
MPHREKKLSKEVKQLRTDGGGVHTSNTVAKYLKSDGISQEMIKPYTSQSNGVVERANGTIMERTQCMLDDAGLSKNY